jgi:hypothetical protein
MNGRKIVIGREVPLCGNAFAVTWDVQVYVDMRMKFIVHKLKDAIG